MAQISDFMKQLYEYYYLEKNGIKKKQKNISSDLLESFGQQITKEDIFPVDEYTQSYNWDKYSKRKWCLPRGKWTELSTKRGNSAIRALKVNKFGRKTSVVDNLFFLRNSLAYGRQIYFYRLKLNRWEKTWLTSIWRGTILRRMEVRSFFYA